MTQVELHRESGVARATISRLESSSKAAPNLQFSTLVELATSLGLSAGYLLDPMSHIYRMLLFTGYAVGQIRGTWLGLQLEERGLKLEELSRGQLEDELDDAEPGVTAWSDMASEVLNLLPELLDAYEAGDGRLSGLIPSWASDSRVLQLSRMTSEQFELESERLKYGIGLLVGRFEPGQRWEKGKLVAHLRRGRRATAGLFRHYLPQAQRTRLAEAAILADSACCFALYVLDDVSQDLTDEIVERVAGAMPDGDGMKLLERHRSGDLTADEVVEIADISRKLEALISSQE